MNHSEIPNAVVLVLDRLGANRLGAYGSTWFETPNFNRLAARSIVFDQAITKTTELLDAYEGLWDSHSDKNNLIQRISESGASSVLLSDSRTLNDWHQSELFDRVVPVESDGHQGVAERIDQTELAQFFAQATQAMSDLESGTCLWMHSRGLGGAWDAPLSLRKQLADPDDPDPPVLDEPPLQFFDIASGDPDQLLGYQQVCTAQVSMIDDFLGVLLDLLESEIGESTMFCLLSTRGYALGEHGVVGWPPEPSLGSCYNESVHVPLMVCLPNQSRFKMLRSIRCGSLVQPDMISTLLTNWFVQAPAMFQDQMEALVTSLPNPKREVAWTINEHDAAIHTHAWKLIRDQGRNELFAKPDDRSEVNDVSRLCPAIVDSLNQILEQWIADSGSAPGADFELDDVLATRMD